MSKLRVSSSMRAGILTDGAYGNSPATADPAVRVAVSLSPKPMVSLPFHRPNSGSGRNAPPHSFFIEEADREFAAVCFVAAVAIIPAFFVFAIVFFAMALLS